MKHLILLSRFEHRIGITFGLLSMVLWASPALATHQIHALEMATDQARISLRGHLSVYRDPSGAQTIDDVAHPDSDRFRPIQGALSEGFTSDVVWLAFSLTKGSASARSIRWLELTQPLLFNAQLFEKKADGQHVEVKALLNQALSQNQPYFQRSLFEIRLEDERLHTYYLRLSSPTSISSELIAWQPGEFVAHSTLQRFLSGAVYGAYAMLIIFFASFAFWTREKIHVLYALYITVLGMATFCSGAWPMQFFPQLNKDDFYKLLGFWVCLNPPLAMMFSFSYLNLEGRWLQFSRVVLCLTFITAAVSFGLILTERFVVAMPLLQTVAMSVISLACLTAMVHSAKGNRNARILLFSFSFFYVGAVLRLLKNLGFLEPHFLTENGYQIGSFIHMLIMSGTVFNLYSKMRREKNQSEYRLQAEINLREAQTDFMSMVSHEFRTPMAIIEASSTNLRNDASLNSDSQRRVDTIQRANARLSALMHDYLSHEQLLSEVSALQIEAIDLNATVHRALKHHSDVSPEPLFIPSDQTVMVMADQRMIDMVVSNLLGNALRYAPGCQPIVRCQMAAGWGQFQVFNDGAGIPEEDLPHIFQKFYRGKNVSGTAGLGLGLYLIRAMLERLNGQILAHNLPTGGCEFTVRLPLQTDQSRSG